MEEEKLKESHEEEVKEYKLWIEALKEQIKNKFLGK